METNRVAGMITMYNSDYSVIDRIDTYASQVETLFVVDNSEYTNTTLVSAIKDKFFNVKYINNNGNVGIASALNIASKSALKENFSYLLMMDDDSEATDSLVDELVSIAARDGVGIASPKSDTDDLNSGVVEVLTTITSGSVLRLDAYVQVGPFMDELFIDWVDHEYCFRLQKFGYKVMLANDIKLKHRLGLKKTLLFAGFIKVSWRSHSPVRLYYKFRNSLYVLNLYRHLLPITFTLYSYKELLEDVIKIIFLEDGKRQYCKLVVRALIDFVKGRLGKLGQT